MPGPSVHASTLVLRLARELRTALDQAFAQWDLTSQQAGLLVHVYAGESSPKELAALLGTDTAGMTRMVDRLERKRLVRRTSDPADRRAILVELTSDGRALVPRLPAVFERVGNQLTGHLDTGDVLATLETMLANIAAEPRQGLSKVVGEPS